MESAEKKQLIKSLRRRKKSWRAIAEEFKKRGIKTQAGRDYSEASVWQLANQSRLRKKKSAGRPKGSTRTQAKGEKIGMIEEICRLKNFSEAQKIAVIKKLVS